MRTRSKLLLAGLMATIALASAVATAAADEIEFSHEDFRMTWATVSFTNDIGTVITCPMTVAGSFHRRTIRKVPRTLIGAVTAADTGDASCGPEGAGATLLKETLPWHLQYNGFTGILPNIGAIRLLLIGAAFRVRSGGGIICLTRTTTTEPSGGDALTGGALANGRRQLTRLRADSSFQIDTEGAFCDLGGDAGFTGEADIRARDGGLLFVRLI